MAPLPCFQNIKSFRRQSARIIAGPAALPQLLQPPLPLDPSSPEEFCFAAVHVSESIQSKRRSPVAAGISRVYLQVLSSVLTPPLRGKTTASTHQQLALSHHCKFRQRSPESTALTPNRTTFTKKIPSVKQKHRTPTLHLAPYSMSNTHCAIFIRNLKGYSKPANGTPTKVCGSPDKHNEWGCGKKQNVQHGTGHHTHWSLAVLVKLL